MQLFSLLAMVAALRLGFATPIDQDPTLVAERSTAEFKVPANFDMQAYQDDIAKLDHSFVGSTIANESLVEKRADPNFQIYRMWKANPFHDNFYIDSSCNGGRCDAKYFMVTNVDANFCDREFAACGIKYKMKYTGKQGSCMRYKWFQSKGEQYGVKYAHLTRNGANVGECFVWNNVRETKACSLNSNYWRMESAVQCFIQR